jgi:hypothetical protein
LNGTCALKLNVIVCLELKIFLTKLTLFIKNPAMLFLKVMVGKLFFAIKMFSKLEYLIAMKLGNIQIHV